MTNQEAKTVQENIASIREVAMAMLLSSDSKMIELAEKVIYKFDKYSFK